MQKLYTLLFSLLLFLISKADLQAQNAKHAQCSHASHFRTSSLSDTLDVISYEIHLNHLDFGTKNIQAHALLNIKSKVDGLNVISLELKNLEVTQVKFNEQIMEDFTQNSNRIHIPLTAPLNQDEEVFVELTYEGKPFAEAWGGFHFKGSYAFNLGVGFESDPHNLGKTWFPCVDDFKDRALYEVYITAPEGKVGISGGSLIEVIPNDDNSNTYHWKMEHSIPTYLASFAVGEYELFEDQFNGLNASVPITIYAKPSEFDKVEASFQNLKNVSAEFEAWFGKYPWERIGYVSTDIGAMEHPTNIAYPGFAINGNTYYESLYSHELSHMWFGDLVTCASAKDMWMNEGWAVFCEILFKEQVYDHQVFLKAMKKKHYAALYKAHIEDGGYFPLYDIPISITYGKTTYDKGGIVVQALRNRLGDDLFFSSVKSYLEHFAYQSADTYQMRDYLSEVSGIDLTDFFDTYVFTAGTPHYSIDSFSVNPQGENAIVDIYLRKRHKGADYIGKGHVVPICLMSDDYQMFEEVISFDGEFGHAQKTLDFIPTMAMVDFNNEMGDATTNLFHMIREEGEMDFSLNAFKVITDILPAGDSAMIRIARNYVAPDPLPSDLSELRISDKHYWKVDGIWSETYKARGEFRYSKSGHLDNELILSENDSVVLLYRSNTAADWEIDAHYLDGNWRFGEVICNNLQQGEYALAVMDKSTVGLSEIDHSKANALKVFPNPAAEKLSVSLPNREKGIFFVFDQKGNQCLKVKKEDRRRKVVIKLGQLQDGLYILRFIPEGKQRDYAERFVISR